MEYFTQTVCEYEQANVHLFCLHLHQASVSNLYFCIGHILTFISDHLIGTSGEELLLYGGGCAGRTRKARNTNSSPHEQRLGSLHLPFLTRWSIILFCFGGVGGVSEYCKTS